MSDTTTTEPTAPATGAETPTATTEPTPTPPAATADDAGKGGNRAVLADLARERDQRQALQAQVEELRPLRAQMEALSRVFGGDTTTGKPEDVVAHLQQQVAEMRHNSLVNDVARRHGITNDEDVAVLRAIKDEALMGQLAERLKAPPGPVTPAPDQGQGARPTTPQADADAEYAQFYPNP